MKKFNTNKKSQDFSWLFCFYTSADSLITFFHLLDAINAHNVPNTAIEVHTITLTYQSEIDKNNGYAIAEPIYVQAFVIPAKVETLPYFLNLFGT